MNTNEIVKALRICNNPKGHRCSECPVFSQYEHRICKATVDRQAADLIESLQAEIAKLEKRIAAEGFSDLETMISKYKTVMLAANEISIETDEELEELRAQLAASQRRAQDARNELCLKCGRYRDAHKGACDGCRWMA